MADRIDHFAKMRAEQTPEAEPPEGAPVVSRDLVDYLEKTFPKMTARPFDGSMNGLVHYGLLSAEAVGQQAVIAHLKLLVPGA